MYSCVACLSHCAELGAIEVLTILRKVKAPSLAGWSGGGEGVAGEGEGGGR